VGKYFTKRLQSKDRLPSLELVSDPARADAACVSSRCRPYQTSVRTMLSIRKREGKVGRTQVAQAECDLRSSTVSGRPRRSSRWATPPGSSEGSPTAATIRCPQSAHPERKVITLRMTSTIRSVTSAQVSHRDGGKNSGPIGDKQPTEPEERTLEAILASAATWTTSLPSCSEAAVPRARSRPDPLQ